MSKREQLGQAAGDERQTSALPPPLPEALKTCARRVPPQEDGYTDWDPAITTAGQLRGAFAQRADGPRLGADGRV